ncbi:hypothetical protein PG993_003589 [Apiospora rasikravindrae]|uniref:Uncharacterized protein n=1 Tax=Apiospora rasikravindrae TaxID=990691 RepID=A0ABR1U2R1_9PEZI
MDFFRFLAEVCNMVYKALLVDPPDNVILMAYEHQYNRPGSKLLRHDWLCGRQVDFQPAVIRLNKRARLEASPFLYSQIHFGLRNAKELGRGVDKRCESMLSLFPRIIGRDNTSLVRHVTVQFPHLSQHDGCALYAP